MSGVIVSRCRRLFTPIGRCVSAPSPCGPRCSLRRLGMLSACRRSQSLLLYPTDSCQRSGTNRGAACGLAMIPPRSQPWPSYKRQRVWRYTSVSTSKPHNDFLIHTRPGVDTPYHSLPRLLTSTTSRLHDGSVLAYPCCSVRCRYSFSWPLRYRCSRSPSAGRPAVQHQPRGDRVRPRTTFHDRGAPRELHRSRIDQFHGGPGHAEPADRCRWGRGCRQADPARAHQWRERVPGAARPSRWEPDDHSVCFGGPVVQRYLLGGAAGHGQHAVFERGPCR